MRNLWAFSWAILSIVSSQSYGANRTVHQLTVAANPALLLNNEKIDQIISDMNKMIAAKDYSWSVLCEPVEFVRSGDLIQNSQLPTDGSSRVQIQALKTLAPTANVLITYSIDCNGVGGAVGCGPVGKEPMITVPYPDFDAQLWLHERGHNVGLQHSAEAPTSDDTSPENVGRRVMFWQLGVGHTGMIGKECDAFKDSALRTASRIPQAPVVVAGTAAMPSAAAPKGGPSTAPPASEASAAVAPALPSVSKQIEDLAAKAGLTVSAFKVIGPPWLHGMPVDQVKALSADDIASIRKMLEGDPNQYWPQAISALSLVGNESDVELIKNVLSMPLPALPPNATLVATDQIRNLVRTKLAVPQALGILANRTGSSSAVDALQNTAQVGNAQESVGHLSAQDLSKKSLNGLAIANTDASKSALAPIINPQPSRVPASVPSATVEYKVGNGKTAPLTIGETVRLKTLSATINSIGLDKFIAAKPPAAAMER
ncbi:hypothetical protein IVB41_15945 [Bradyrhizobium sp. 44]|uniref:hypothetical protein n=1 Tax=Bradyrhizobium sp. 44 TaxID=2782675 RepID=UPI001FF83C22|nr:hypothetical protein [Bradyrhizobium sp. 44]MCK1285413.1 hypothetical protein [Bradyrhizobium sp. 44]